MNFRSAGAGTSVNGGVEVRPADVHDPGYALRATGLLADFNTAGILHAADVHAAIRIAGLVGERADNVRLAMALAIRAVRHGSVCIDLSQLEGQLRDSGDPAAGPAWPEPGWLGELAASPLVAVGDDPVPRPLRLVDSFLYLDKYWRQERLVAREFDRRTAGGGVAPADSDRLAAAVQRLLTGEHESRQRIAALTAATRRLVIVAGGPGTGKTTAVARILAALADQPGRPPRIALAAPTGKAAARLSEAVRSAIGGMATPADQARLGNLQGVTLHRLLGWRPGNQLRFNEFNRLGYDIVVVDEASMLSLTMMARLLAALRDDARLILVGDPDQLESVDAGVVLADLVDRARLRGAERSRAGADASAGGADASGWVAADLDSLSGPERALADVGVVTLTHRWRFGDQREIVALADAIVAGDADRVVEVVRSADQQVRFIELADVQADTQADAQTGAQTGAEGSSGADLPVQDPAELLWEAVSAGRLAEVQASCLRAVRAGWSAARAGDVEGALAALGSHQILCAHRHGSFGASTWSRQVERWARAELPGYASEQPWYVGRPVMMRVNDVELGVFNGDTGILIEDPVLGRRVAFAGAVRSLLVSPTRLGEVETVHALTIHKSQGSQYDAVTLILPPLGSPLLTRELLYTAVTRATSKVTIVGGEQALRAAVSRPVARASGLRTS